MRTSDEITTAQCINTDKVVAMSDESLFLRKCRKQVIRNRN